jgi:hypothetical protein
MSARGAAEYQEREGASVRFGGEIKAANPQAQTKGVFRTPRAGKLLKIPHGEEQKQPRCGGRPPSAAGQQGGAAGGARGTPPIGDVTLTQAEI